ncbi:recombination associated protein RdgC [Lampropedia hyalina DSM 16112]|uniref:Recombination-associated protein RdgC n=1 Tax=Lampropedia hyalina DSM 16112 TaxID=1122156 RepID=A0A1M4ZC99_9BURK|nr:recombination-associated protein RdgC [Lampropedia hyalina]SHF15674.1 recombination associated protein RdgC [Lampropedia hyalina DSM 16112]
MFKNLLIYRLNDDFAADLTAAEQALAQMPFAPCGKTQDKSSGWVAPRGQEHGPLVESIHGQWMLRFVTQSKILPASVVQAHVDEKVQAIEQETGRKPGKKERQSLKDEARLDLLPLAFTKTQGNWVWLDRLNGWLVIDASAQGRGDEIITALVEHLPGLAPRLLQTQEAPGTAMAQWLAEQQAPAGFALGDECELKATDDTRAVVRYARHALEIDEIRQHIEKGKRPTRLALAWGDRAFFVLSEALQIKKLTFAEAVFSEKTETDEQFDADVAITTGELALLLPELVESLGGYMDGVGGPGAAAKAPPAPVSAPASRPQQEPVAEADNDSPPW